MLTREVETAGGKVTVRELTVAEVFDLLRSESGVVDDGEGVLGSLTLERVMLLGEGSALGVPLAMVAKCCELTREGLTALPQSEVLALQGAVRELNPLFLSGWTELRRLLAVTAPSGA